MAVRLKWPILGIIIPTVLIAGLGYGSHFFVFRNHMETGQQVIFQVYLTMVWVSYVLAIKISPGTPPANFEPKKGEWRRWCKKCNNYKPERTHHCKTCNACVMQMDHHCPWTYNCVGHGNMVHFLRFLAWVIWTTGVVMVELGKLTLQYYEDRDLPSYLIKKSEMIAVIFLLPIDFFVFATISILMIRCLLNIVFKGMTQIEVWEMERIEAQFHTERMWSQIRRNYYKLHGREMPELTSWNASAVLEQQEEREYQRLEERENARDSEEGIRLFDVEDTAPTEPPTETENSESNSTTDGSSIVPVNFTTDDLIFPYDLGPWKNITNTCGYPWAWLIPWTGPNSNGFHPEKTSYLEEDQLDLPWPPDGGHQEQTFANDSNTDLELSDHKNISLLRKRLDPRSTMQRSEWVNDMGDRLDDFGVDLDAEDTEHDELIGRD